MSLVITGTMAFDAVETPFGKVDRIIGGSATYAAWAASALYHNIKQVSIVGYDFPEAEFDLLAKRGVSFEGVEIKQDEKSFFWSGRYHEDMNTRDTLITDLNVLASFNPQLPESYLDCEYLMLGNLVPVVQQSVIKQLRKRPKLIIMDTMNFWMETAMDALKETMQMVDLIVLNDAEARQLTGEYSLVRAAQLIRNMGPKYVVIKKGEHGALLFYEDQIFAAPALPLEEVFDPTGAGDSFAGGFIGHIARANDISYETMKTAVIMGSAMASFCVEKFGPERMKEITPADIQTRLKQFKALSAFNEALELI
ncbi:MAG TPA: PfkB family carbohydrate kinase [Edaphocola sp.]|nr:PfkB family carbohydrate kinase [Edaphocola sp.]